MSMRVQLSLAKDTAVADQTVIVRLSHAVAALDVAVVRVHGVAFLIVGHLPEAGLSYELQFAVLPPMRHHLVGVRADEVAFQTMKVR